MLRILALAILFVSFWISRYATILFVIGVLPSIISMFFVKNTVYSPAMICSFNTVGIAPFFFKFLNHDLSYNVGKEIIEDPHTWLVIYGSVLMGQILYFVLPICFLKIYEIKISFHSKFLDDRYQKICTEWDMQNR